jgi:hypothetical protein
MAAVVKAVPATTSIRFCHPGAIGGLSDAGPLGQWNLVFRSNLKKREHVVIEYFADTRCEGLPIWPGRRFDKDQGAKD